MTFQYSLRALLCLLCRVSGTLLLLVLLLLATSGCLKSQFGRPCDTSDLLDTPDRPYQVTTSVICTCTIKSPTVRHFRSHKTCRLATKKPLWLHFDRANLKFSKRLPFLVPHSTSFPRRTSLLSQSPRSLCATLSLLHTLVGTLSASQASPPKS